MREYKVTLEVRVQADTAEGAVGLLETAIRQGTPGGSVFVQRFDVDRLDPALQAVGKGFLDG